MMSLDTRNKSRSKWVVSCLTVGWIGLVLTGCSMPSKSDDTAARIEQCPVMGGAAQRHTAAGAMSNGDWWPNQLNVAILHQNPPMSDPFGEGFDYAAEFSKLDLDALRHDLEKAMTTSKEWWPADWGHYGPLMIRLAWHSAGTYRTTDGRGGSSSGTIRFAPLNSWPDNANLDKARRLLWPVKQKYGRQISWADLMVLAGNVALESMGFETFGFAGGREDVWGPEMDIHWGPESSWLGDQRFDDDRNLDNPLAASQMGLIYVNPQGPNGQPDPLLAAHDIRLTFGRMAMNDEETVALIAGGHTLGKCHGAADPNAHVGREPEGESIEQQGLGWLSSHGKGNAEDTITSGLEGAWTSMPVTWSHGYFENLFEYDWKVVKGPGGAWQWTPVQASAQGTVPDAHVRGESHAPMMLTTDLALREDPIYGPISRRFYENPEQFNEAFARAWYKLTHRDMGPHVRLLGSEVPPPQLWQDPIPAVDHALIEDRDVTALEKQILDSGLSLPELVSTAWSSAATYRGSDRRGGANGARVRLAPQKSWAANQPAQLAKVLESLESIRDEFNRGQTGGKRVSLADLIVIGGGAAIEEAARRAGHTVEVPFAPGRTDATQAMTEVESFAVLEPIADGFRNYIGGAIDRPAPELLLDRAQLLSLTAPEMTALVAGMRQLNANHGGSAHGVLTDRPGTLSNDWFVHLLDMDVVWTKSSKGVELYEGRDRATGEKKWTATSVDLVFGSNSQLRAIAEVYASDDGEPEFVADFVAAWTKVMNLDRFDLDAAARAGLMPASHRGR